MVQGINSKVVITSERTMDHWVMGYGSLGSHKSMGQIGHGSRPLDPVTHDPWTMT